jgi:hypothetical protein
MTAPKIRNTDDLAKWLGHQPTDQVGIIAVRIAMRALPAIQQLQTKSSISCAIVMFRALFAGWASANSPENFSRTARMQANEAARRLLQSLPPTSLSAFPVAQTSFIANEISFVVPRVFSELLTEATSSLARALANSQQAWRSVSADCDWLTSNSSSDKASRELSRRRLWLRQKPNDWQTAWEKLADRLIEIDPNFSVWLDWFERRIRGESPAFDIPADKRRVEDERLVRRLAATTDQDFWDFGHEYVNATLKGWLDEARARVAPAAAQEDVKDIRNFSGVSGGGGPAFTNADEMFPLVPAQNRNALSFRTDEDGRITIDASASVDQLRTDADARDRHSEAASEANAVLDRCRSNNAAARLTLRLENYLAAIGPSIEDTKPSLLVQRGEKLRQELAAYAAPDTLLDPIADDILVDLKGWQSSHNIMVGLDPVLMAIDTAMLGPDRRPALIPPDEIKQFARDAQEADLLAEGTEEIIIEAADLAPTIPDPEDRRTNFSREMVKNLCLETFSIALNHPRVSAAAIAASVAASSNGVAATIGGISVLSSIKAAEYLVTHRQWIEERMGNWSTWQALFVKVADWLEMVTPFKPK